MMKQPFTWGRWIAALAVAVSLAGCADTSIESEPRRDEPKQVNASLRTIASNLNYPRAIHIVTNEEAAAMGTGSALAAGQILVANGGLTGDGASTVMAVNNDGSRFVFSDATRRDLHNEPGVSQPTGVDVAGSFVWVSNAGSQTGTAAALDPNPALEPNGPTGALGEPIAGPTGTGVFGGEEFGFRVARVVPHDGAQAVSITTAIFVEFTKPVNPVTVTSSRVNLTVESSLGPKPQPPIIYTELREGNTVLWIGYDGPLAEDTVYKINLDYNIEDVDGNELDGDPGFYGPDDFNSSFNTYSGTAWDSPRVIEVTPGDGVGNVPLATDIWVRFSEPVDGITATSFYVTDLSSSKKLDGTRALLDGGTRAKFYPEIPLSPNTCYSITVTIAVEDRDDNPLDQIPGGDPDPFRSRFCTGTAGTTFCVISQDPPDGSSEQDVSVPIELSFSDPPDVESVRNALTVSYAVGGDIPGTLTSDGQRITFTPTTPYAECNQIVVRLAASARSTDGKQLDGNCDGNIGDDYVGNFNTRCDHPYVISVSPACGQQDVPRDSNIAICFSEFMDHGTLPYAISVDSNAGQVPGNIFISDAGGHTCVSFTPVCGEQPCFAANTQYFVNVSIDALDSDGRNLDQDRNPANGLTPFQCSFTTGSGSGGNTLCVTETSPADSADQVSISTAISVVFNQDVDPRTVDTNSFRVFGCSGLVNGTYRTANRGIVFTPATRLDQECDYTVTLTTALKTMAGVALDGDCDGLAGPDFTFSFRTGRGGLVINEVVVDPQQDWDDSSGGNGIPFDDNPGTSEEGIGSEDEWIEIYNGSDSPVNLTGYRLLMIDGSDATETIGDGADGVEVYSPGSGGGLLQPDDFLVIGNPAGTMNLAVFIQLIDNNGSIVDQVEIGEDPAGDGQGDCAPAPGQNGDATGIYDESVARCPNGMDTDNDPNDFAKGPATIGSDNTSACGGASRTSKQQIGLPAAIGLSGLVFAGDAPDDPSPFNQQLIMFNSSAETISVIDFDDGLYLLRGGVEAMSDLAVKRLDGGDCHLFIGTVNGTVLRGVLQPSGTVGQPGTALTIGGGSSAALTGFTHPMISDVSSLCYSIALDRVFVADRGSGNVAEMTPDGEVLAVYITGLGPGTLSAIDVGDLGEGEALAIATTGGSGVTEYSGPYGQLFSFLPVH